MMVSINPLTASSSRTSQEWNSYGNPSTARRAQVTTVAPCSAKTELMPDPTPRTPPVTRTTRPASPKLMASKGGHASARVTVLAYQASACLGSYPTRKWHLAHHIHHHRTGHRRGYRRLPARQRHPLARLVRTCRHHHRRRPRSQHPRG